MKQRKINNDVLQQMLSENKTQRECAAFFGVSDAAISKVVKRWEAEKLADQMPESLKKLTEKQQNFALAVVSGKSRTAAAAEAYDAGTLGSAKAMGAKLMKEPDVATAISDLLAQEGLSKRARIKRLSEVVNAKDLAIASRGLDLSWKLDGSYAPTQVDVQVYDSHAVSQAVAEVKAMIEKAQQQAEAIEITDNT